MDPNHLHTAKEALKVALEAGNQLEMSKLMRDFMYANHEAFFELIPEVSIGTIAARLLKSNPDNFIFRVHQQVARANAGPLVIEYLLKDQKVSAIKKLREVYGLGLKEAKDITDRLHHELHVLGKVPTDFTALQPLRIELQPIFNDLMECVQ